MLVKVPLAWQHYTIVKIMIIHPPQDQNRIARQVSTSVHERKSSWVIINEVQEPPAHGSSSHGTVLDDLVLELAQ